MGTRGTGTIATSKLTSKAQAVVPREIRERLGLRPGDTVRYRVTKAGVVIDKRPETEDDPFVDFVEWAGAEDEEAFKDRRPSPRGTSSPFPFRTPTRSPRSGDPRWWCRRVGSNRTMASCG